MRESNAMHAERRNDNDRLRIGRTPVKVVAAVVLFTAVLLAITLAGALSACSVEEIDRESLVESFKKIHRNIYEIYRLNDGGEVYDTLALSCAGRELENEVFNYLKCLRVQEELDTWISIVDVIYNDVRVVDGADGEAEVFCKWIVIGKVRHPTHIHRKVNLNEALYKVALLDEGLRITGYDLLTNQAVEVTNR